MDCELIREALSAQLDGEDLPVDKVDYEVHLSRCLGCQAWSSAASSLHRSVRIGPAEQIPDLTPAVLVAIGSRQVEPESLKACRVLLAVCALLQLLVAVPALFGVSSGPIHMDHELGSWDIGLASGFLIAALQPQRAWGMLPFLAVVAGALVVTSAVDVVSGSISATRESAHVTELMGFALVYLVARMTPRPAKSSVAVA